MNTLYIDTHSEFVEIGLFQNNKLTKMIHNENVLKHSVSIMPSIDSLLRSLSLTIHDISDILVINGPGSFTGVRLGVTIAKTMAFTLRVPIRVMSSILIKAVSNIDEGYHWFAEKEKNGYFIGKFNDLDELVSDYIYVKNADFANFCRNRDIILDVSLDYQKIYEYSRTLPIMNAHAVNPLYVKKIEVMK